MTTTGKSQSTTPTQTQLQPYLFFYGRCEEALAFYKKVFGGTYELKRNSETPMECEAALKDKIMHAQFQAPGVTFLASDGGSIKPVDPDAGNISLSLSFPDNATGARVFAALAEGGTVKMPLENVFWGGRFGMIHDRFGTEWMVSTP